MSDPTEPVLSESDVSYFRVIEGTFISLRGAPLLLSPADWRVAQGWRKAGIPLSVVCTTLESVFAQRQASGKKGKIQSLRFCANAIEEAWQEVQELGASRAKRAVSSMDVEARLGALAAAVPDGVPGAQALAQSIRSLRGSAEEVERSLARLDAETLEALKNSLEAGPRADLEAKVEEALAGLRQRLPDAELNASRTSLRRQILRRQSSLPMLSLFAAPRA